MIKGLVFSLDIVIGISLLLIVLISSFYLFSVPEIYEERGYEQQKLIANDFLNSLAELKVSEAATQSKTIENLILNGNITEDEQELSVLNLILTFFARYKDENNTVKKEIAENITKEMANSVKILKNINFSLSVGNDFIIGNYTNTSDKIVVSSLIENTYSSEEPKYGYMARSYLSGIETERASYLYFGGFVGQGNLSFNLYIPENAENITSAYLEVSAGSNFSLFVNNNFSGNFFLDSSAGNFSANIKSSVNISNFRRGNNTIKIVFNTTNLTEMYLGGGFLRVNYNTTEFFEEKESGKQRYYFPGINGLINLYDSFYIPGDLNNMSIYLHYNNTIDGSVIYLTIANATIFRSNATGGHNIILNNTQILSNLTNAGLSYANLSRKTIPLRLGTETLTLERGFGVSDAVLITDVSGSMGTCDVNSNCTSDICDTSPPCHRRRINVAKEVDIDFVSNMLNVSGNRVSLVAYETGISKYHELSEDKESLINEINSYVRGGYTCICCGIKMAIEALKKPYLRTLVSSKDEWLYTANYPTTEPPVINGSDWKSLEYNDTNWSSGRAILGFDNTSQSISWYFQGWNYRVPVDISNTAGNLTDYQIKITYDFSEDYSNGNIQQYCQDIRFTYYNSTSGNQTEIPYWIEECNLSANDNATIWVKVPFLENNAFTRIYMYYGNSTVSSESNGTAVFEFFDDFEGTSLDSGKWNTYNTGGSYSISGSTIGLTDYEIISKSYQITDGIIEVKEKITAYEGSIFARATGNTGDQFSSSYGLHSGDFGAGNTWNLAITEDNVRQFTDTTQAILNEWLLLRFTLNGNHLKGERFKYVDMSPNGGPVEGTLTKYSSGYIGLRTDGNNDRTCYYDWIRVRKYTSPEPTITFGTSITTDIGNNGGNYYFRKHFYLDNPTINKIDYLYFYLLSDDKAEVYLNGKLIYNETQEHNATYWNVGSDKIFCDGFETGINTSIWTRGGSVNPYWIIYNNPIIEGYNSSGNNDIGNNQESWIKTSNNISVDRDSIMYFYWKVSSQNDYDFLSFYLNDLVVSRIDGKMGWRKEKFYLPVDNYSIKWKYRKDSDTSTGLDAGWIDDIRIIEKKYHLNKSYLKGGDNVIAVKLYNNDNESAKFDLKLEAKLKRRKAMLVMSDGQANRCCGYSAGSCWSSSVGKNDAIQAGCDARDQGILVYSVAFGSSADKTTLQKIACWNCSANDWISGEEGDNCSRFYQSSNVTELKKIYKEIASEIANLSLERQVLGVGGNISWANNYLYNDSHILFYYNETPINFSFGEFSLTIENNFTSPGIVSLIKPSETEILDAKITSYSGDYWTNLVILTNSTSENLTIYNLSKYGNYERLGDPFIISIPVKYISNGTNNITLMVGLSEDNQTLGSNDSKLIYSLKVPGFVGYGSVFNTIEEAEEDARNRLKDKIFNLTGQNISILGINTGTSTITGVRTISNTSLVKLVYWRK